MMKALTTKNGISAFCSVDPSWTSSSVNCATIGGHFKSKNTCFNVGKKNLLVGSKIINF